MFADEEVAAGVGFGGVVEEMNRLNKSEIL